MFTMHFDLLVLVLELALSDSVASNSPRRARVVDEAGLHCWAPLMSAWEKKEELREKHVAQLAERDEAVKQAEAAQAAVQQKLDAASKKLAEVVLDHSSLTDFGGIPMAALRENSVEKLDLDQKGIEVPGAFVLAGLIPAATALQSCR